MACLFISFIKNSPQCRRAADKTRPKTGGHLPLRSCSLRPARKRGGLQSCKRIPIPEREVLDYNKPHLSHTAGKFFSSIFCF